MAAYSPRVKEEIGMSWTRALLNLVLLVVLGGNLLVTISSARPDGPAAPSDVVMDEGGD
jgi:hypothetical protein